MNEIKQVIRKLAEEYSAKLKNQIDLRKEEMKGDENSHYLIYRVLGVSLEEGQLIDEYQNIGRFCINMQVRFLKKRQLSV